MNDKPPSMAAPCGTEAEGRLFGACRMIVAQSGFGALSLRSVARAGGWTMGEIAYRVGTKRQLVAAYLDHERIRDRARDGVWLDRLGGVGELCGALLAATVEAFIDDVARNDRDAAIVWHEAMLEVAGGAVPSDDVIAWIEDRRAHWRAVLRGRHPQADLLGKVVADYIVAEQIYSVALSADPAYRLIRSACTARLCGVRGADGWRSWASFLPIASQPSSKNGRATAMGRHAQVVAEAAAQLILDKGASAVTHRSVASVLGQSSSAVAHHFSARVDLMAAGFESLFHSVRLVLHDFVGGGPPAAALGSVIGTSSLAAIGFVRAMHFIALVAARDAAFVSLMFEERAARGRLIEAWYGEELIGEHRTDRLFLQIVALVTGVRTLASSLNGEASPGGNRDALSEMLNVMA